MKNYLVCAVTLLILLIGCAPKVWHKDGATQNDYEKINYHVRKKLIQQDMDIMYLMYVCTPEAIV